MRLNLGRPVLRAGCNRWYDLWPVLRSYVSSELHIFLWIEMWDSLNNPLVRSLSSAIERELVDNTMKTEG